MSSIIGDAPCPQCRKNGRDSTGDHLILFDNGNKYCNRCNYKEYNGSTQEEESIDTTSVADIKKLPCLADNDRGIRKEVAERFGVHTEVSEETGQPVAKYYPITIGSKVVAYKKRTLPKTFSVVGQKTKGLEINLFGQAVGSTGKKLLIVEGEEDGLAAYQMLKDYSPRFEPSVLSLPTGAGTIKSITDNIDYISTFLEVIICTDQDKEGEKCKDKICAAIGDRAKVMKLPEKDASDMLVKGMADSFIDRYFKAKQYRPASIVSIEDILEDIVKPVDWGLSYPWESLTKMTYGMKSDGEIICLASGPGVGKSTFLAAIQTHLVFNHGERIALFDIEQGAVMCGKKIVGAVMKKPIHKPDCIYDPEEARDVGRSLEGKVEIFDGHPDWDTVAANIRYFAAQGIRYFFIDPLSSLVQHVDPSLGNTIIGQAMKDMMKMRKELGITFFHVNHLNNPAGGKDHASGGEVKGSQVSGSRAQWKYSTLLLGITRDLQAAPIDGCDINKLVVIKDRLGGNTGSFNILYDKGTGELIEQGDDVNEF